MIGVYAQESVVWVRGQGLDAYGTPLSAVESTISARVRWKFRTLRDYRGVEVVSAAEVLMSDKPDAGQDKIRIDGEDHAIVAVHRVASFSRTGHWRAYVQ
jgi:hypothetical protein